MGLCVTALPMKGDEPKPTVASFLDEDVGAKPFKDLRFNYVFVAVPAAAMAEALLADTGDDPLFWDRRIADWEKAGVLELLNAQPFRLGGHTLWKNDGEAIQESRSRGLNTLSLYMVSEFWEDQVNAKADNTPPPDPVNGLLQEFIECGRRDEDQVKMQLTHDRKAVNATIRLCYQPKEERQEIKTWPIGIMKVERFLFRSFTVVTSTRLPLGETVLLGSQMEAPHEGEVQTGRAIAAFGQIHARPGLEAGEDRAQSRGISFQTWTLSVPKADALPWLRQRRGIGGDAEALQRWMGNSGELLGVAAVATDSGVRSEVVSKRTWIDGCCFECNEARTDFRVAPNTVNDFSVEHGLLVDPILGRVNSVEVDPFRTRDNVPKGNGGEVLSTNVEIWRPSQPARWIRIKSAMERGDDDPAAVEVADRTLESSRGGDERFESHSIAAPGQAVMVGALLKGERVHITFQRGNVREAVLADGAGSGSTSRSTVWTIETPLSWQAELLKAESKDLAPLATKLLDAVDRGEANLVAMLCGSDAAQSMVSRSFVGSDQLNFAIAPKGIFFSSSGIGRVSVGHSFDFTGSSRESEMSFLSIGEPEFRHWGLWQPQVATTTSENSGVEFPIFPMTSFKGAWKLKAGAPQVVAAVRIGDANRSASLPPSLRWLVVRQDIRPQKSGGATNDTAFGDEELSWQAVVVPVKAGDMATAEDLWDQAKHGAREILENITVRDCEGIEASAGRQMWFMDGRHDSDLANAPEVKPAVARLSNHVDCVQRIIGFHLEYDGESQHWKVERDEVPPKIIADAFDDAEYRFPAPKRDAQYSAGPPTTVNVQRPIFKVAKTEFDTALPAPGALLMERLSPSTVLLVRRLR